jgi:predicted transcriptional regulator
MGHIVRWSVSVNQLPSVTDPDFGDALRRARESAGLSHSDLARRINISRNLPAKYESGLTEPKMSTWKALNEALFPAQLERGRIASAATGMPLKEAPLEAILDELGRRGYVEISFKWRKDEGSVNV